VDVRVMTFNLLATARSMEERAATIHEAAPDLVLVQELTQTQARALDVDLAPQYPYRRMRTDRPGWEGAGIWSRFPIQFEELWDGSRRGARWQHAVLSVEGQAVHVVNLHLMTPVVRWHRLPDVPVPIATGEITQGRSLEVTWLVPRLQELTEGPDPVIVAGDLNMTDQTPEYRRLLGAGLADAHRQAGWGFGHSYPAFPTLRIAGRRYPVPVPLVRIDYVLHSPRVQARHVETWPTSGGSDHRPVVADLVLES
jgi:endonuclease/exonuclease/phosphatase family metal-dependent hydrolase